MTARWRTSDGAGAGRAKPSLLLTAREDLAGYARGVLGRLTLASIAALAVLAVLLIFAFVIWQAVPFFLERGLAEFFTSRHWAPDEGAYGALVLFFGSAAVTVLAMAVAVPVGLLSAVCLSDIVPFGVRQVAKPVIELLAAIPSVAYGFFALLVLGPWLKGAFGLDSTVGGLTAGIVLAIMALPTIVSIGEDALSAVGRDLREGAYALGATRAEVLVRVVIPAARSGLTAAILLGVMRAVGETMAVWMAAGMAKGLPTPWWDITQSVRTLTATIAQEMGEASGVGLHRKALFALGLVLLSLTFLLNLASEQVLNRASRRGRAPAK